MTAKDFLFTKGITDDPAKSLFVKRDDMEFHVANLLEEYASLPRNRYPTEESINLDISLRWIDANLISDGYHTFGELYAHRIELWIQVCRREVIAAVRGGGFGEVWRSKAHSDGSVWAGWFILGMYKEPGKQITYHLPMSDWDRCEFAETLDRAPDWDGHTSADVLERIKNL